MNRSGAELFIDMYMYALFFRFWTIFGVFSTKKARFLQNPLFAVIYIYVYIYIYFPKQRLHLRGSYFFSKELDSNSIAGSLGAVKS